MSKEIGPRERQLREQREARFVARNRKPNPFEDAARGRDATPTNQEEKSDVLGQVAARRMDTVDAGGMGSSNRCRARQDHASVNNPVAKATKGKIRTAGQDKDASRKTKVSPPDGVVSRLRAGRTAQDAAASSGVGRVAIRGRPKKGEVRAKPWEALGISKASYYRQRAAKGEKA